MGDIGVGLGQSRAKWNFLPEAETDFIFAVIAEETGLIGGLLVQAQRPPAAAVTLQFRWPPGTTAFVETDFQRKSGIDPAPDELASVRMTHRMRVLPHRDGLELRFEDGISGYAFTFG